MLALSWSGSQVATAQIRGNRTWLIPAGAALVFSRSMGSQRMLIDAREHFPQLVAFLICFGMPVGVSLGIWGALHPKVAQVKFNWGRAIIAGGFAGTRHYTALSEVD